MQIAMRRTGGVAGGLAPAAGWCMTRHREVPEIPNTCQSTFEWSWSCSDFHETKIERKPAWYSDPSHRQSVAFSVPRWLGPGIGPALVASTSPGWLGDREQPCFGRSGSRCSSFYLSYDTLH
jgi:hypothetical protein